MGKAFVDHFQGVTQHYLNHRPSYPAALFDWLAQRCSQHELAWDCGTGNGQAAVSLAQHFQRVLATDAS
ncbi:MAG: SAM-dependent methyltransferase, partial [Pseudomonas sp.]|nr:SAM-dependent methyltransferase [Pseudomonas sp.]